MVIEVNGDSIEVDREGYLLDPSQWNEDVARELATKEDIELTEDAWEVVNYIRGYFIELHAVPEHRRLLQELKRRHGKEKATRKYVYNMFPYGYAQQACKIAGMRVPLKLVLDV